MGGRTSADDVAASTADQHAAPHDDNDIFIVDDQHDVIDDDQHNEHDDGAGLNDQFDIEHFHDDHDRRGRVIGTRTSEAT